MAKRRVIRGVSIAIVALVSGLGMAIAQESDDTADDGSEGGEIAVRRDADLSGPEQMAEGERINGRGEQISRRITGMLDEARRERDIIRVTCLNDKLTQVNANLRTVEQRLDSLRQAVQTTDSSRRNHEFTVLTVLGQKFNVLEQEANQCIGQDVYETGATRVTTTIDPSTSNVDPEITAEPPLVEVPFIPPPASPTT